MPTLNEQIASCVFLGCKVCGESKARIPIGMYPDGRDIKHVDDNGRTWNGHVCGYCDNERKKVKQKIRRDARKLVNAKRRERYARSKQSNG